MTVIQPVLPPDRMSWAVEPTKNSYKVSELGPFNDVFAELKMVKYRAEGCDLSTRKDRGPVILFLVCSNRHSF